MDEPLIRKLIAATIKVANCHTHTTTCKFTGCTCRAAASFAIDYGEFCRVKREVEAALEKMHERPDVQDLRPEQVQQAECGS